MLTVLEEALESSPNEVNLFLQGVTIGEVGAVTVLRHLRSHEHLTLLELRGSSIGCKGAEYLATGLISHPTLKHLGLGRNGLGSKGALHILKGLVTQADNLAESDSVGGGGLETLDLESNMIQDIVGQTIGELITKSRSLVALSLEKNDMRMDGAIFIANGLKHSTTLRNLNLAQNRCGMAASNFGEALQVNRTLLTLNLASNGVYPDSAKFIIEALSVNHVIKAVNLQHNQAIDAFAAPGSGLSPRNSPRSSPQSSLRMSPPAQLFTAVEGLEISPNLKELNLFGNRLQTNLAAGFAATLRKATGLIALSVGRCSVNGVAMVPVLGAIASLVHLSTLDLVGCGLSTETAKPLANTMISLPNLGTLLLDENRLEEDGSVIVAQALSGCSALTNLSMDSCGITLKGALEMGRALVHRKGLGFVELHLSSNSIENEGMISILDALCYHQGPDSYNLQILDLHSNTHLSGRITGTLAKLLELHPKLGTVNIKDTVLSADTSVHFMTLEQAKEYATEYSSTANAKPPAHNMGKPGGDFAAGVAKKASILAGAGGPDFMLGTAPPARSNFNGTSAAWHESAPSATAKASTGGGGGHSPLVHALKPKKDPNQDEAAVLPVASRQHQEAYIPGLAPAATVPMSQRRHQLHDVGQNIEQFPVTEVQLRKQFSLLDTTGDGVLQRSEFEAYFQSLQLIDCDPHSFKRISELVGKYCDPQGRLGFDGFSIVMLRLTNM